MLSTINAILQDLQNLTIQLSEIEIDHILETIISSHHIFVSGKGRSGLMIRAFANRLMHLGFSVSILGEITTPATQPGDLLIIGTASGETPALIEQMKEARNAQLTTFAITSNPTSTIGNMANLCYVLPAPSKIDEANSAQPMGSLFEQASLLFYDTLVLLLMQKTHQNNYVLKQRHANIE